MARSPHAAGVFNAVHYRWTVTHSLRGAAGVAVSVMLAGATLCLAEPAAAATGDLVLGVLEQPQCKDKELLAVRPVFAKRGRDWQALARQASSHKRIDVAYVAAPSSRSLRGLVAAPAQH